MKKPPPSEVPILAETEVVLAARQKWQFTGRSRPRFANTPGSNQESVWDYPRPPIVRPVKVTLEVQHQGNVIASSLDGKCVLETAGAPTYYFPPVDVNAGLLQVGSTVSLCEWKGLAESLSINGVDVGWRYIKMYPGYEELHLWVSFYPMMVNCYHDGILAEPQPGGYYGGWVTKGIVGPVKGKPGSEHW